MPVSWFPILALVLSVASACSSGSASRDAEGTTGSEPSASEPTAAVTPASEESLFDPECSLLCEVIATCHLVDGLCVALTDEDCQNSNLCKSSAQCTLEGGQCVRGEDDCAGSTQCSDRGRCGLVDGMCEAVSSVDCAASRACEVLAQCSLADGSCSAAEDADCRGSDLCTKSGACFLEASYCVAKDDADCRASEMCENLGRCTADAGLCVATRDEDCSNAPTCESYGACTAVEGVCSPASDADCASSSLQCETYGRCGLVENQCAVLADADCRDSALCASDGACVLQDGACVVATSEDCASSQACELFERCVVGDGVCVVERPDCDEGLACPPGTCVDFDECEEPSDLECARSIRCAQQGLCSAGDSGCVATPATCAGSEWCESRGRCVAWHGVCHTEGDTDADCRGTNECMEFGWCSSVGGVCVAAEDVDCEPSVACLAEGLCAAFGGECIRPPRDVSPLWNEPLEVPMQDDATTVSPSNDVEGSPDAWSEPRVTAPEWRLPVPAGRLAFPPHEAWQDRRVHLPAFELDETEVTIARLRSYVEWAEGRPPAPGSGAVSAIDGSGWNPAWDEKVSLAAVTEQLRLSLTDRCEVPDGLGAQVEYADESVRPANCISWYTAFALCISEGGRLPTIAEWTYAAEGGPEGRLYPWGDASPTQEHVAMQCLGDGLSGCSAADLLDVGSRPLGAGRWGHLDLAGSLEEPTMDAFTNGAVAHVLRSSGFQLEAQFMPVRAELYGRGDDATGWYLGARCMGE